MNQFELSVPSEDIQKTLLEWLGDYIDAPHPELGRDGPVCPFVGPSLRVGSLLTLSYEWQGSFELPTMVTLIHTIAETFRRIPWESSNTNLHSLVVVVDGLPEDAWWLIDEGHKAAKDDIVAQGLMLGQFHPLCTEPAARNPLFPVNRAPYPLYAIRNMALHDILFLHDNPTWFHHYQKRFGHRYGSGTRMDPQFSALYSAAESRRVRSGVDHWEASR